MRARAAGKKKHRKKWSHVILMLSELCRCLWVNAGARWTRRMWFPASVMLAARCAAETGAGLWNRTLCQGCRRAGVPETSANPGYSLYTDWYVFSSASAGCFFLRFFYCFLFFPLLLLLLHAVYSGPGCRVGDAVTRDILWFGGDVLATIELIKNK